MPIALESPGQDWDNPPVAKIPDVGDHVTIHVADVRDADVRSFETGEIETFDDGNPKKQKVVTGIVKDAAGNAHGRKDSEDVPLTPGDQVTIFTGFGGFYAWREGLKNYGKPVSVGDVVTWATEREEPPKRKGYNPFKVRTFTFRAPTADETQQVLDAEAVYLARQELPALDDSTPAAGKGWEPGTEPF